MSFLSLNLLYNFCENSFKPGEQHLEHLQARLNITKMLETGNSSFWDRETVPLFHDIRYQEETWETVRNIKFYFI